MFEDLFLMRNEMQNIFVAFFINTFLFFFFFWDFRKAVNEMKEMKLLLDMYKGVGKEQRDKVQLMAAERKTRAEVEELRQQIKKIQVSLLKGRGETVR